MEGLKQRESIDCTYCHQCGEKVEKEYYILSTFYSSAVIVCRKCYVELMIDTSFLVME